MSVVRRIITIILVSAIVLGLVLILTGFITGASVVRMCTLAFGSVEKAGEYWISFAKSYADIGIDVYGKIMDIIASVIPMA